MSNYLVLPVTAQKKFQIQLHLESFLTVCLALLQVAENISGLHLPNKTA